MSNIGGVKKKKIKDLICIEATN